MIRVLFVCLGNICRSPMAEFIMKSIFSERGLSDRFYIALFHPQNVIIFPIVRLGDLHCSFSLAGNPMLRQGGLWEI